MICRKCGQVLGDHVAVCNHCGAPVTPEAQDRRRTARVPVAEHPVEVRSENILLGTVGALLGALLGAACIVLLGQVNFVASISGLVLAVCSLKGYSLLGGRMSKKGAVICLIIMLITPFLANNLDWAITVIRELEDWTLPLSETFLLIPQMVKYGMIDAGSYAVGLLMLYGFTALGAYKSVIAAFKS